MSDEVEIIEEEDPAEPGAQLVLRTDAASLQIPTGDKSELWGFLTRISESDMVPAHFRRKPASMLAAVVMGRELGLSDMSALQQIYVIEGKVTLSANLIRGLIWRAGHTLDYEERSAERCRVTGTRKAGGSLTVEWTMDDARAAGVAGKGVWKSYPRAMLDARATTELARALFPDCLGWATYAPEDFDARSET